MADGRRACVVEDVSAGEETMDTDPICDTGFTTTLSHVPDRWNLTLDENLRAEIRRD